MNKISFPSIMNIVVKACFIFSFFLSQIAFSKEYVSCKLFGQLGNQLFQIAAATSLALDNNAITTFPDLINELNYNIPQNRRSVFSNLNVESPKIEFGQYVENEFNYHQIPYKPNLVIKGYFQSEKYFKHNKEKILEIFQPSIEIVSCLEEQYSDIMQHPKTVAIHVRTYQDTKKEYHPFIGWRYFQKAINLFDTDFVFLVFSDNIEFCKRKMPLFLGSRKVKFISSNSHILDLYLMSFCKHQIISNSSFSWWGAYLNRNPLKKVISPSPQKWFGCKYNHLDTSDIIPEDWIIIE